jgi:2',3'-cyclic-nucleotide 2'-phosphodiesterase (5'-nucleotidase family)
MHSRSSQQQRVDARKSHAEDGPTFTEAAAEARERLEEIEGSEDTVSAKVAPWHLPIPGREQLEEV